MVREKQVICELAETCRDVYCAHRVFHSVDHNQTNNRKKCDCTDLVRCGTARKMRRCVEVTLKKPSYIKMIVEVWVKETETKKAVSAITEVLDQVIKKHKLPIKGKTVRREQKTP